MHYYALCMRFSQQCCEVTQCNWISGSVHSPTVSYNHIFKQFLVSWPKATTCSLQLQYGAWKTLSRNIKRTVTPHRTAARHFSYSDTFRTCTGHSGYCTFRAWEQPSKNNKDIGNRLLYLQELHSGYKVWSHIMILYKTVRNKNALLQISHMTPHLHLFTTQSQIWTVKLIHEQQPTYDQMKF
jgi:hypothetical protein